MSSRIRNPAAYAAAVRRNAAARTGGPKYIRGGGDYVKTHKVKKPVKKAKPKNISFGEKWGAVAGRAIQQGIKRITGIGDYKESGRPLNMGGSVPQFANVVKGESGGIRVQHREYIQDIQGSVAFAIQAFTLNPGLNDTFPWLDAVAANFEQYHIHGMQFYFKATSATAVASTNTALGTVILATQYNANAAAFSNKQQMENYQFAQSGVPFNDICHSLECDPKQSTISRLYIRTGSVPSGQDARLYDFGVFYLATVGMQAASTIGELWVTYDIELLKPRIVGGSGGNIVLTDHFNLGTTPTSTAWFGTGTSLSPTASSNIGGRITPSASTNLDTYTFPDVISSGTYLMLYRVVGSSSVLTNALTVSTGTNIQQGPNIWINGTANAIQAGAGETSSQQYRMNIIRFVGSSPGQSFYRFTAGTLPGSLASGEFLVTQINPVQVDLQDAEVKQKMLKAFDSWYEAKQRELKVPSLEAVVENVNRIDVTLGLPTIPDDPEPDPPGARKRRKALGLHEIKVEEKSDEDDDGESVVVKKPLLTKAEEKSDKPLTTPKTGVVSSRSQSVK